MSSRHRRAGRGLLALVGSLLVITCGDAAGPVARVPDRLVTCTPPITVTVDAGAVPRIGWSPTCGATYLEVTSPDHQQVYWIIQGDTGKIAPGVLYGVDPPDYTSRFGPLPLERGAWYVVRVGVMVDENSYAEIGEGLFQR